MSEPDDQAPVTPNSPKPHPSRSASAAIDREMLVAADIPGSSSTASGSGSGSGSGRGSGTAGSSAGGAIVSSTLREALEAPSRPPDVVVLDVLPEERPRKDFLDPTEDLWLSTADGRYNAPIIPLRVGWPNPEIFYVHKDVLLKADYFQKALCGKFIEGASQTIDFPDEDPAIFHHLVAFLYEQRYAPIRAIATVLAPDPDKGKGKEDVEMTDATAGSSSTESNASDSSTARSRHHRERRLRMRRRQAERMSQKHPGVHRPNCNCPQCLSAGGPPCWHCSAPRAPPTPRPLGLGGPAGPMGADDYPMLGGRLPERHRHRNLHRRRAAAAAPSPPWRPTSPPDPNGGGRISGEDLRTWLLTYELNLDVYICADRFLMDDFKREVARVTVDMLETAGSDAAHPAVLRSCYKLYRGLGEADPLLRMIYARVGFLQPVLWRRAPEETGEFLAAHPEVTALILRETAVRREEDASGRTLPSMERLHGQSSLGGPDGILPGMPGGGGGGGLGPPPPFGGAGGGMFMDGGMLHGGGGGGFPPPANYIRGMNPLGRTRWVGGGPL